MNLNKCINYCINLIKILKLIFFLYWNRGEYGILIPVCWTKVSNGEPTHRCPPPRKVIKLHAPAKLIWIQDKGEKSRANHIR